MTSAGLPPSFERGFATASYQIEGGVNEDGRDPSVWDIFAHLEPSRCEGATGDIACDHFLLFLRLGIGVPRHKKPLVKS